MMLRTHGLGLHVPDAAARVRWLVRDLDLELRPAELVVVVGPNGSGKTTLLRALAGVRPPDAGHVTYDGIALADLRGRARARSIAYLPQSTPLYHDLSVAELVGLGRAPHLHRLRAPGSADASAVREALVRVGAHDLRDRSVSTLSGGERQRVMLARMLATGATMLVMDEPTAALDVGHVLSLLALFRELAEAGHGLVVALHDLDLARRHGDRALCLSGVRDGGHRLGRAADVLTAEHLGAVFGVRVLEDAGGLRFLPAVD